MNDFPLKSSHLKRALQIVSEPGVLISDYFATTPGAWVSCEVNSPYATHFCIDGAIVRAMWEDYGNLMFDGVPNEPWLPRKTQQRIETIYAVLFDEEITEFNRMPFANFNNTNVCADNESAVIDRLKEFITKFNEHINIDDVPVMAAA